MPITVIHHSADYDGLFCRDIARKFLPEATLIGWDFGDAPLIKRLPSEGPVYILDLPVDRTLFGAPFAQVVGPLLKTILGRVLWIDHHKSSIETHPADLPGYRIDGVAACRLAWQWFTNFDNRPCTCEVPHSEGHYAYCLKQRLPLKEEYVARKVPEPLALRLAGEYDVWDHRGDGDLEFQFGLDCLPEGCLPEMLAYGETAENTANHAVTLGKAAMACYAKRDADTLRTRSFKVQFEGLTLLVLNTARCNSNTFTALDVPETGHDALCGFFFNGHIWKVSLYHAGHRKDLDLSRIAIKHGGGGHRGACGFESQSFPF